MLDCAPNILCIAISFCNSTLFTSPKNFNNNTVGAFILLSLRFIKYSFTNCSGIVTLNIPTRQKVVESISSISSISSSFIVKSSITVSLC